MSYVDVIEDAISGEAEFLSLNVDEFDPEILSMRLRDRVVPTSEGVYSVVEDAGLPTTNCSRHSRGFDWHTDGLSRDLPPRWVVLYCENPGTGGVTTEVVSALVAAQELSAGHAKVLGKLVSVYVGRDGRRFSHPIIGSECVRLASRGYVTSQSSVEEFPSIRETAEAMSALVAALDDAKIPRHIQSWRTGDVLVLNNHRCMHRRVSTARDLERRIVRMWFS